jgi:hypothetical protein
MIAEDRTRWPCVALQIQGKRCTRGNASPVLENGDRQWSGSSCKMVVRQVAGLQCHIDVSEVRLRDEQPT